MRTHYRRIAGQSLERLAALSDGIFSVAMTLLVLNLSGAITSGRSLQDTLIQLWPRLLPYCISFLTLGNFWIGQQTQHNHLTRSDRYFAWIHLGFLFMVSLTPFSTALFANFITSRFALIVYWLNILLLGISLLGGAHYADRAGLVQDDKDAEIAAIKSGLIHAQALYALGALLCIINTYVSITFIIIVQLSYTVVPQIELLSPS